MNKIKNSPNRKRFENNEKEVQMQPVKEILIQRNTFLFFFLNAVLQILYV